ncbi:hypothetical protein HD_0311 [[Haemophilus] ducreyi 35000HP]|uniref:Uncharacterized protein n=1 Tax=Haemophilus ducreyi (strain 35000HP / ATCC 700724) TaxID=233412 RepID=Q7VP01_HAEDU|nr:hypothetical protein HD_0311 [[Haemophilus] ducreyi 35000HP]
MATGNTNFLTVVIYKTAVDFLRKMVNFYRLFPLNSYTL